MQKVAVVLQELGISRAAVERLANESALPYRLVWQDECSEEKNGTAEPDDVAALITINKPIDQAVLDRYPNVKMVAVAFTGYDCVDAVCCRDRGIAVCNVPDYSTDSVAELTVGLAISLLREIPRGHAVVQGDSWDLGCAGTELARKRVGVIGTGRIGLRVASLFKAFRCEVVGWSRSRREEFAALGGEYVSWEEAFATSDIVTLHIPLNEETRNLVGKRELEWMKLGACLINTARGPVLDQATLLAALDANRIRAAIDVFDSEPLSVGDAMRTAPNTVLTPHIAYKTEEALTRRAAITIQNLLAFAQGENGHRVI